MESFWPVSLGLLNCSSSPSRLSPRWCALAGC